MSIDRFKLWEYKYAPTKFEDMILNDNVKAKLSKALKNLPNLMLYGPPGTGKGTFTNILLDHTSFDNMWINASDETGIDVIRDKVKSFSTALGMTVMKIVVFNEADSLSQGSQGAQKMLKQLMEDVEKTCRFVYLTNDLNLMTDALKSRCQVIEMSNPPLKDIGTYASKILKQENIKFDTKVLVSIIKKCYPDIRKTVSSLQENVINGELKNDRVISSDQIFGEILKMVINQDLENIRKTLRSNYIDYVGLYEFFYENVGEFKSPGGAILKIGDHLRWNREHANKEINFMHMVMQMIWEKIV
jgi:DNA polymerase III delta prime subunit